MSETSPIHSGAIVPAHLAETPKSSCPSLARRPCTPQATKHQLASSRQAISQHLDVLEQAGLIRSERRGRYKFHELDTTPLERIVDRWLHTIKEDVCASS